jgi:hypothetical protein
MELFNPVSQKIDSLADGISHKWFPFAWEHLRPCRGLPFVWICKERHRQSRTAKLLSPCTANSCSFGFATKACAWQVWGVNVGSIVRSRLLGANVKGGRGTLAQRRGTKYSHSLPKFHLT